MQRVNHLPFWNRQHPSYTAENLKPCLLSFWALFGIHTTVAKINSAFCVSELMPPWEIQRIFLPQLRMNLGSSRCTSFVVRSLFKSKDFYTVPWNTKKTKLMKNSTSCMCHYNEYDLSWPLIKNITSFSFLLPWRKTNPKHPCQLFSWPESIHLSIQWITMSK